MKRIHFSNRGQALIIFVFALIGLVGMTGLAVDGTHILAERRKAQNAADTAAMAGALAKVNGQKLYPGSSQWTNAACARTSSDCWTAVTLGALNRAQSNGYDNNGRAVAPGNTVSVYLPPISGPYSNCSSYSFDCKNFVQVVIETNVSTWFARVLGVPETHNRVEAVALARYEAEAGLYGGNALVILAPHNDSSGTQCNGAFKTTGNINITLNGGGAFVNSDNPTCAFVEAAGCVNWTMLPPGPGSPVVSVYGGSKYDSCSTPPPIAHASEQVQFPPDPLFPEPEECRLGYRAAWQDPAHGNAWHYYPGHYDDRAFPPERNAFLDPGVYCVDNLIKTTNQYDIQGDGVFLYVRPGGSFDFQGGHVRLTAPTVAPYKGYLLYVASTYRTWGDANCTINGDVAETLTGVIYAPNCNLTVNGGSGTLALYAQMVSYTLNLAGSAGLNFTYDANLMPRVPEKRWTGLYH
ncbi:MAG TPA: pilus assembly protein TadG-related protein [Geobacteraceae bacterium]